MARIGFIGLGNMGLPMAQNLIKAGHAVTGLDMSKAQIDKFEAGGKAAGSVKDAASGVDIVVTMLPAGEQVRDVYLGDSGMVATASPATLLIHSSTIDVETARAVVQRGAGQGARHARCAGVGRRRGRTGRDADLHGRRARCSVRARQADPRKDGQDHRSRRRSRQRPGSQNLQQHDPRRIDDRGVGSFRAGREARAGCSEAVRYLVEVVRPVLVDDEYCPVPGPVPASPANRDYQAGFTAAMMLKDLKLAQDAATRGAGHRSAPKPRNSTAIVDSGEAAAISPASSVTSAKRKNGNNPSRWRVRKPEILSVD